MKSSLFMKLNFLTGSSQCVVVVHLIGQSLFDFLLEVFKRHKVFALLLGAKNKQTIKKNNTMGHNN